MKVYKFYMIIDDNEYSKLSRYIDDRLVQFHGDKRIYLYAWTNKKSYYKNFMKTRNKKMFSLVETSLTEELYDQLRVEYKQSMLIKYKEDDIELIVTNDEKTRLDDYATEYLDEYLCNFVGVNPYIFDDDLYYPLSKILYTYFYSYAYGTEDEYDLETWNLSFTNNEIKFNPVSKHILIHGKFLNINKLLEDIG